MITSTGRKTHSNFDGVFREIFERHPEAETFDPCPCGLTLAIIQRKHVREWHFVVPDEDLRLRVSKIIDALHLPFTNHDGPDATLVICEIA